MWIRMQSGSLLDAAGMCIYVDRWYETRGLMPKGWTIKANSTSLPSASEDEYHVLGSYTTEKRAIEAMDGIAVSLCQEDEKLHWMLCDCEAGSDDS